MLVALRVHNFIVIESLELRLEPGFNVLTGETGAGKSIVIGALTLVLGGRARANMVRPGADEACIEALFDVSEAKATRARLEEMGVNVDDALVVRRIVAASGRSRAYLNGRLCTVGELSALAGELADVTSQHASVALADPSHHLDHLDQYAGLVGPRDALGKAVDDLREVAAELRSLQERERERLDREAFVRYQLDSIDAVAPQSGEIDALSRERDRLRHAERLSQTTGRGAEVLDSDHGGLLDDLGKVAGDLQSAASIDDTLSPFASVLDDCWARLGEVARDMARYAEGVEADPTRLEAVQERLFKLDELLRRHGPTIDDALAARSAMERELTELAGADERISELGERRNLLLAKAATDARKLSKRRQRGARQLGKSISAQLSRLGMGAAKVLVQVSPLAGDGTELVVDGARLSREGIDRAQFLISPNKGVEPLPLRRIASGGELSRALLALKGALGALGNTSAVQVFDEVDSGIGGAAADCIGRAIADIARHRQVLCITHLASIAAHADAHFVVSKHDDGSTTTSVIEQVAKDRRVAEIARMLTGSKVAGPAKRAAMELLSAVTVDDAAQ